MVVFLFLQNYYTQPFPLRQGIFHERLVSKVCFPRKREFFQIPLCKKRFLWYTILVYPILNQSKNEIPQSKTGCGDWGSGPPSQKIRPPPRRSSHECIPKAAVRYAAHCAEYVWFQAACFPSDTFLHRYTVYRRIRNIRTYNDNGKFDFAVLYVTYDGGGTSVYSR